MCLFIKEIAAILIFFSMNKKYWIWTKLIQLYLITAFCTGTRCFLSFHFQLLGSPSPFYLVYYTLILSLCFLLLLLNSFLIRQHFWFNYFMFGGLDCKNMIPIHRLEDVTLPFHYVKQQYEDWLSILPLLWSLFQMANKIIIYWPHYFLQRYQIYVKVEVLLIESSK